MPRGAIAVPFLAFLVVVSILLVTGQPRPTVGPPAAGELAALVVEATATPTSLPLPTPTPTATPIPDPVRIVIPAIKVDAPMSEVGVLADGRVEEPPGPDEVSWTNGGAKPGAIGNAILSGHFDWSIPYPRGAVFWRLRELKPGAKVTITLADETELSYEVESSTLYLAATAPGEQILAQTPDEIITIITCEGTYDRTAKDYSHRRVVVAKRLHP